MNEETRKQALRLLDKRDYSRKMLLDKLTEKGAEESDALEVVDWLCEIGAVSDTRYAELLVRHYSMKGYGPRRIRDELYRRGIERDLWDEALSGMPETDDTVYRLLSGKLRGTAGAPEDLQKAQNTLLRRGYSWEEIRTAMERYRTESEDSQ